MSQNLMHFVVIFWLPAAAGPDNACHQPVTLTAVHVIQRETTLRPSTMITSVYS